MAVGMHNMKPPAGAKRNRKRVGRGLGSTGTYSGRGGKGQTARSGVSGLKRLGMKRWVLAQPKVRGFKSLAREMFVVNVGSLEKAFSKGGEVNLAVLKEIGLVPKTAAHAKLLSKGDLTVALKVTGMAVSAAAKEKIEKAGGSVS